MSRLLKLKLLGGVILMTMSQPVLADTRKNELTIVNPANLYDPTPNGYSTAVVTPDGARIAYISGQGGQDHTGRLSPDFEIQVKQAYANLAAALDGIGAKPGNVAKLTTLVVDHEASKLLILTKAVVEMFGDKLPAQTLIPVPTLAIEPMLFEVEAIVILD